MLRACSPPRLCGCVVVCGRRAPNPAGTAADVTLRDADALEQAPANLKAFCLCAPRSLHRAQTPVYNLQRCAHLTTTYLARRGCLCATKHPSWTPQAHPARDRTSPASPPSFRERHLYRAQHRRYLCGHFPLMISMARIPLRLSSPRYPLRFNPPCSTSGCEFAKRLRTAIRPARRTSHLRCPQQ